MRNIVQYEIRNVKGRNTNFWHDDFNTTIKKLIVGAPLNRMPTQGPSSPEKQLRGCLRDSDPHAQVGLRSPLPNAPTSHKHWQRLNKTSWRVLKDCKPRIYHNWYIQALVRKGVSKPG